MYLTVCNVALKMNGTKKKREKKFHPSMFPSTSGVDL